MDDRERERLDALERKLSDVEDLAEVATRLIEQTKGLPEDIRQMRRALDDARRALDEFRADVAKELKGLTGATGALVVKREGPDGEETFIARPSRFDLKSLAMLVTAFGVAGTPIVLALLHNSG